ASKYAIIFMSDGLAPFPEAELQTLVELHGNVIKKFWTLALGQSDMSILKRINEKMDGTFFNLADSSELVEAYAEIARTS
ncbi:unnamed protein product, partial [Didymodactylos carnosus]